MEFFAGTCGVRRGVAFAVARTNGEGQLFHLTAAELDGAGREGVPQAAAGGVEHVLR